MINLKHFLLCAKETDLDVIVSSNTVNYYIKNPVTKTATGKTITLTIEDVRKDIQDLLAFVNGDNVYSTYSFDDATYEGLSKQMKESVIFDNVIGLKLSDEASSDCMERYEEVVNLIKELWPDCYLYTSQTIMSEDNMALIGNSTGNFTYDYYPLMQTVERKEETSGIFNKTQTVEFIKKDDYYLADGWLKNMSASASTAKGKYNTGIILQSFGMENAAINISSDNPTGCRILRNPTEKKDIAFQVYSALAYGMKQISYFSYWELYQQSQGAERFTMTMVQYPTDETQTIGDKTPIYEAVQKTNQEITKFDHVFLDYDWQGTVYAGTSEDGLFDGLASYDVSQNSAVDTWSVTNDGATILSHMYDGEKQLDGFWAVNVNDPSTNKESCGNIVFDAGYARAMVFDKGKQYIVALEDHAYDFNLLAGEGIFVIPLK